MSFETAGQNLVFLMWLLINRSRSISEIAYNLRFKYPVHFTRLFKNTVGCTPVEYRNVN